MHFLLAARYFYWQLKKISETISLYENPFALKFSAHSFGGFSSCHLVLLLWAWDEAKYPGKIMWQRKATQFEAARVGDGGMGGGQI